MIAYLEIFDQWKQVWDHHRRNHRRPHRRRFYKIQDTPSYIGCGAETVRGFKPKGILQKITLKSRKNLHARPGLYKTFSGIQRQQLQNAIAPSYGHQTQQCHAQDLRPRRRSLFNRQSSDHDVPAFALAFSSKLAAVEPENGF